MDQTCSSSSSRTGLHNRCGKNTAMRKPVAVHTKSDEQMICVQEEKCEGSSLTRAYNCPRIFACERTNNGDRGKGIMQMQIRNLKTCMYHGVTK